MLLKSAPLNCKWVGPKADPLKCQFVFYWGSVWIPRDISPRYCVLALLSLDLGLSFRELKAFVYTATLSFSSVVLVNITFHAFDLPSKFYKIAERDVM